MLCSILFGSLFLFSLSNFVCCTAFDYVFSFFSAVFSSKSFILVTILAFLCMCSVLMFINFMIFFTVARFKNVSSFSIFFLLRFLFVSAFYACWYFLIFDFLKSVANAYSVNGIVLESCLCAEMLLNDEIEIEKTVEMRTFSTFTATLGISMFFVHVCDARARKTDTVNIYEGCFRLSPPCVCNNVLYYLIYYLLVVVVPIVNF